MFGAGHDQPLHHIGLCGGERQRDRATGGKTEHINGVAKLFPNGVRVVRSQILHSGTRRQPNPAIDSIHAKSTAREATQDRKLDGFAPASGQVMIRCKGGK